MSGLICAKGPTTRGPHICTHSNNRQHFLKVRNNREQLPLTVTEDRTHTHVQRRHAGMYYQSHLWQNPGQKRHIKSVCMKVLDFHIYLMFRGRFKSMVPKLCMQVETTEEESEGIAIAVFTVTHWEGAQLSNSDSFVHFVRDFPHYVAAFADMRDKPSHFGGSLVIKIAKQED